MKITSLHWEWWIVLDTSVLPERITVEYEGWRRARGLQRGATSSQGNSNDVDRVGAEGNSRRSSPPAAKRDGNGNTIGLWGSPFTGVAGAVWSLRSSLIPREAFRSFPERNERRKRREAKDVEDPFRRRLQNAREGRDGEHRRPTNRRGLTDVATPYVTFIADALSPSLLLASCFTPPKWEKETIPQFLRFFYRCRIASYFSFFHFRHRQIRAWRCTFSFKTPISMKERSTLLPRNYTNIFFYNDDTSQFSYTRIRW